jgi:membrane protein implicated in regulation of membrane protease activity
MRRDEMMARLRLVLILAIVLVLVAALLYLVYGFALVWQALASGIIIAILCILIIVLIGVSIFLWTKNFLMKRELKRSEMELAQCRAQLKKAVAFKEEDNEN